MTGTPCCEQLKGRKLKSCTQGSDWLPDTRAGCNSLTDGRLAHLRPAPQPHAGRRGFPSRSGGARPSDRPSGRSDATARELPEEETRRPEGASEGRVLGTEMQGGGCATRRPVRRRPIFCHRHVGGESGWSGGFRTLIE